MPLLRSPWFAEALPRLVEGGELSASLMAGAINDLTSGAVDEIEAASFLIALRMKGETGGEIAAAVRVLRGKMTSLATTISGVLDTCGTGGDGSGTFNISTAVSLVAAAAGCPVVKHGNRSVSSRSGSADVLAELGVPIEKGPAWAQTCLEWFGFAFCFAPHFHPVLAHIGPLRRKLGVRTIFNLLGPLLNPASAPFQLLGVGKLELLDPLAEAIALLGMKRASLVCSEDGLDEVSLSAPTHVRQVENGAIKSFVWDHNAFGLPGVPLNDLRADGPLESAAIIRSILLGEKSPARFVVLANAATALLAAERADSLPAGVALAAKAIDSGAAARLLDQLSRS